MKTTPIPCSACRANLPRYTHKELSTGARSSIAAHLDTCDACYRIYMQQRDVSAELQHTLPALGTAGTLQLTRLWSAVQSGLTRPQQSPFTREPARFGFAALVLTAALLLPWLAARHSLTVSLPLPPTPAELNALVQETEGLPTLDGTPAALIEVVEVAAISVTPPAHPNYAPVTAGATSAP